jgi:uncharacterized protein
VSAAGAKINIPAVVLPSLLQASESDDPLWQQFWAAADEGRLDIQRCSSCGAHRHPPRAACYRCQSLEWKWFTHSGSGRVFTYIWVDHPVAAELAAAVPYNVAVIELDETEGDPVRIVSNVVDVGRDELDVGLRVEAWFPELEGGRRIPVFSVLRED